KRPAAADRLERLQLLQADVRADRQQDSCWNCVPVTARGYSADEKRRAQAKHDQPAAAALGDEIAEQEDHAERDQSQGQERARKHRAAVVRVGLEVAAHWLRLRRSLARESCSEVALTSLDAQKSGLGDCCERLRT